jgi:hypothetical protein
VRVQGLVSIVKLVAMLQEYTTEGQRSFVRFLWAKGLNAKDIHKETFPVYGGRCLAPTDFHLLGPLKNHRDGKHFADDKEAGREVRKWVRQQSEDFYAAGFDALITQGDECINVGGG